MRATKANLDKLESLLVELGYHVRYEKGNFRGGYCLLEDRKLVMVNKFFPLESRMSTLADVLLSLKLTAGTLSQEQLKLLGTVQQAYGKPAATHQDA